MRVASAELHSDLVRPCAEVREIGILVMLQRSSGCQRNNSVLRALLRSVVAKVTRRLLRSRSDPRLCVPPLARIDENLDLPRCRLAKHAEVLLLLLNRFPVQGAVDYRLLPFLEVIVN